MAPPADQARRGPIAVPEVGLTVVFEPDRPSLDVVFVHGFTGSPDKTWTHRQGNPAQPPPDHDEQRPSKVRKLQWRNDDRSVQPSFRPSSTAAASTVPIFWPRELLPQTIPDARVLTYGYDTHLRHKIIGRPVNQLTVYDIAKDFLVALQAGRRKAPSRPVLFVCHSLGGIIVKEMLRQACHCQDNELRAVSESTAGIMFFGTPHSGADPRELFHRVVEKLVRLTGVAVNEQVVNALLPSSERLRELRDEFNPIAQQKQWKVHSFQESYGVRALGGNRVVEDMSSYLGLGPLETTEHIYRDHMDMCRFTSIDDPEYLKVAAALRRLTNVAVSRLKDDDGLHADKWQTLDDHQREVLLRSLRFSSIDSRLLSVKPAHAKTCSWFLKSTAYLDWLGAHKLADHHGFLWIKAKPGAGKSTLMKFVLSNHRRNFRNTVSFFFNARGTELERTTVGMYRSLLLQLLEQRPRLRKALDAANISPWNVTADYAWSVEPLKLVFEETVHLLDPSEPVTCFVDALDECPEEEIRDMVEFFEELGNYAVSNQITFRVLFSSRHYPRVTISKGLEMVLEAQNEHFEDIKKYVESRLKIKTKNVEFREDILTRIQQKASGVFMWVVLVVDILNKSHDEGRPSSYIRKKLEDLPGDLGELFRDILTRDPRHRDELLLCLQWILFARRPLIPEELFCAIYAGVEPQYLMDPDPDSDFDDELVERFILNSSKGLAEIINTKPRATTGDMRKTLREGRAVQFIHESVRDFLLKEGGLSALWPHLGDTFQARSHDSIKACCLSYLSLPGVQAFIRIDAEFSNVFNRVNTKLPLLWYATQNVLFHADAAAAGGAVSPDDFLRTFSFRDWLILHNATERYVTRTYSEDVSLLYVLAEDGLAALIPSQAAISGRTGLEVEAERFGTAWFAALAVREQSAALAIMRTIAEADPSNQKLQDLCDAFARRGTCARWNRSFHFAWRVGLLWNALWQEDDLVTLFLLALKPETRSTLFDINLRYRDHSPLMYAAADRPAKVIRALIEAGADTEAKSPLGKTALVLAVEECRWDVVGVLLDANASIDSLDIGGLDGLLVSATKHGLEAGASVAADFAAHGEARSGAGQTPPRSVTRNAETRAFILETLLQRGAQIEAEDEKAHRTPLAWAATHGNNEVVEFLLEKGANIQAMDGLFCTPLGLAAMSGGADTVKILLERGADMEKRDSRGHTPLMMAAAYGAKDAVRVLLEKGADMEARGWSGETTIILAARSGAEEIVKLLLQKGAPVETPDQSGMTPRDWAEREGYTGIVNLLQQAAVSLAISEPSGGLDPDQTMREPDHQGASG